MAAKGTESKRVIFANLKVLFPKSFWEEEGKILRVPMNEDGNPVEIKITLTAAKNILGNGAVESAFPAASEPVVEKPVEMTEEEKENVATLLASLNL